MKKQSPSDNFQLVSISELLGEEEFDNTANTDSANYNDSNVMTVQLSDLHEFQNHPFKVLDNDEMDELVESIKEHGVINPVIVRPRVSGDGFELISGHRRKHACELAGVEEIRVFVKDFTDDEATIVMVDSNIQRENILPSEKAFSYRMKMEAMKHQGVKSEGGINSASEIGSIAGESKRQVHRYIRLTYLIPEFMDIVDTKRISTFSVGVPLSYLSEKNQHILYDFCCNHQIYPTPEQSIKIKECAKENTLNETLIAALICEKKAAPKKVVLKQEKLSKYFENDMSSADMEDVIIHLLEQWHSSK